MDTLLGFKKYQPEDGSSEVLSMETMKELFKESETRLVHKLTESKGEDHSSTDGLSSLDPSISFL